MHLSLFKQQARSLFKSQATTRYPILSSVSYGKICSNQDAKTFRNLSVDNSQNISELQNKIKSLERELEENQLTKLEKDRNIFEETMILGVIGCVLLYSFEREEEEKPEIH